MSEYVTSRRHPSITSGTTLVVHVLIVKQAPLNTKVKLACVYNAYLVIRLFYLVHVIVVPKNACLDFYVSEKVRG